MRKFLLGDHRHCARRVLRLATMSHAPKRRRTGQQPAFKPGRFDCAYCRRSVRGETHLRHIDPDRSDTALCTHCFSVGVKVEGELWTADDVRVIDSAATGKPLLVEDWAADQEVRLLEGILQYGFGNWRAIAEHMGGDKTEASCEQHYERFYLKAPTRPLPDLSGPPQPVSAPAAAPAAAEDDDAASAAREEKAKAERRGASGLVLDGTSVPACDLVGYMPLRGEYDTECAPRHTLPRSPAVILRRPVSATRCASPCDAAPRGLTRHPMLQPRHIDERRCCAHRELAPLGSWALSAHSTTCLHAPPTGMTMRRSFRFVTWSLPGQRRRRRRRQRWR